MKKYIGVKIVEAKEMNKYEFFISHKGGECTTDNEAGYMVKYPDGYESWCPKKQFEEANTLLADVPDASLQLAGEMYDIYCTAVGGKAWNGDILPKWSKFRADETKKKQSDAWVICAISAQKIILI